MTALNATVGVLEDAGLGSIIGTNAQTVARDQALRESSILNAVMDVLRTLPRQYLDPFSPAVERNAEVIRVIKAQIADDRKTGRGPLARVPADDDTLLALFAATAGWGPAQRYFDDPRVNEVKIVGRRIRVQEAGKPFVTVPETFATEKEVADRAKLVASLLGVRLDAENPQNTVPVQHGTRMHVTIPPRTADGGVLVCIRRGRREAWDLDNVLQKGTMDEAIYDLLQLFCRARCSFLIAGRTGSGKTGLLEGLANSWPGDPHILTIEDGTREIGIRRSDLWTCELVDTLKEREAFGRVAREALRQTPDLLLPGEIRGNEAGAILRMVLSDHPVITTLHARSCEEALEQFASCAALPDAYMYEGRRNEALQDACSAFDVVIKTDLWEDLGKRLITEVALVNGSRVDRGIVRPLLVPLAKIDVQENGAIRWRTFARTGEGGILEWIDAEKDVTPAPLREKLVRARALAMIRAASTTLDVVQDALNRTDRLLLSGDAGRALATLKSAWAQRRDVRLLNQAQRALALDARQLGRLQQMAQADADVLARMMEARRWLEAHQVLDRLMDELGIAAAAAPVGGWEVIEGRIRQGLALNSEAEGACVEAETALMQHHPSVASDLLKRFSAMELSTDLALRMVKVREQAQETLVARGEGSPDTLQTIRAQRSALEHRLQQEAQWDIATPDADAA
jgi:pilus assembly protein CpaF